MNIKDLFEKIQAFSVKLDELIEIIKAGDDISSAKALKELLQFLSGNRITMKEVLTNMRVCLKNKARCWMDKQGKENCRKTEVAKNLVGFLILEAKVFEKPKETLINYCHTLDEYLDYQKNKSKKVDSKKLEKSLQTIKNNILDLVNVSKTETLTQNIILFKELVVLPSKKEDLEIEIVEMRHKRHYYYCGHEWLDKYENGWEYSWSYW